MKQKIAKQRMFSKHFDVKSQSGITLIALVITIIVLLILAGISINLVLGENGVLAKAKYASFVNEMTAVEEKLNIWKTGEVIDVNYTKPQTKIPTAGLYGVSELEKTTRLAGEVGYYRVWDINETKPDMDINSSASIFNNAFESELVYYPAGVQDLYYLSNDELGITGSKKYLIDASNGMVYSTVGTNINGIQCYSLNMAKMAMGGYNEKPAFAAAEVSGSAGNLAGNVSSKYLVDENGNYILDENGNKIENPDYNPYGFQIIADYKNDNIYKLYNNGDLYGKGIKGNLLNTSTEKMNEINQYVWHEMSLPDNIPGDIDSVELIPGNGTMFVIDINKDLWAWGENHYNYLGLTQDEQLEYTGREAAKLNLHSKKVYKVIPTAIATWVITVDNELYVCGYNNFGELGIGKISQQTDGFEKVEFNNPKEIKNITSTSDNYTDSASIDYRTIILMNDGKLYWAGNTENVDQNFFKNTDLQNTTVLKFTEIFNGTYGKTFNNKIVYIAKFGGWASKYLIVLDEIGTLYRIDASGNIDEIDNNVKQVMSRNDSTIYQKESDTGEKRYVFCPLGDGAWFNSLDIVQQYKFIDITEKLQEKFETSEIKDFYITYNAVYFLLNDGKVYASGNNNEIGINISSGISDGIIYINEINNLENIEELIYLNNSGASSKKGTFMLRDSSGKYYATGDSALIFRNSMLEKKWVKVNPDGVKVKKFNAKSYANSLAFIDSDNDIWILGDDARILGINHSTNDLYLKNFVRLKDYLQDLDIYNNISGKVEDYCFNKGSFYIKTNSEDNDTLYVCGVYEVNEWPYYSYLGLNEDAYIPTKLFDSVSKFTTDFQQGTMVLLKDNKLYIWGDDNGYMTTGINSKVPVLYNKAEITDNKIQDIYM